VSRISSLALPSVSSVVFPVVFPLVIALDSIRPVPWKNGGGVTRELLAHTRPGTSKWHYRISVATIEQAGEFSIFPNVERWFAVLEGAPVELTIDGAVQTPAKGAAPLQFSGSAMTSCKPTAGSTKDLNLMVASTPEKTQSGAMHLIQPGQTWRPQLSGSISVGLFAATAGTCHWSALDDSAVQQLAVGEQTLLWFFDAPATLDFEATSATQNAGWWMEVVQ
jgi:uncharacterized protein